MHVVVITAGLHGRAGVKPDEAALKRAAVFGAVSGTLHGCLACVFPFLPCWGERRDSAVGRVNDQRRPLVFCEAVSIVQPEVVVCSGDIFRRLRGPPIVVAAGEQLLLKFGGLFVAENFGVRKFFRALQGRNRSVVPYAAEVGLAPRCSRGLRVGGLALRGWQGCQNDECQNPGQSGESSPYAIPHGTSSRCSDPITP